MKAQHQVEIAGGAITGAASYRYRVTDAGRIRVGALPCRQPVHGVAPVPYDQYRQYMTDFVASAPRTATQERVREAFSHLVVSQPVLDQLGPAINSGHSMFVYGPPGNGKTVIAQAIRKLLDGEIAIPHALEVEGRHHPASSTRSTTSRSTIPMTPTPGSSCRSRSTAAGSAASGRW